MKPTREEQRAIADIQALAERWPKTLWLYTAAGQIHIMRMGSDGEPAMLPGGGVDPAFSVANVDIHADGGDW